MTSLDPRDTLTPKMPFSRFSKLLGPDDLWGPGGVGPGWSLGVTSIDPLLGVGGSNQGALETPSLAGSMWASLGLGLGGCAGCNHFAYPPPTSIALTEVWKGIKGKVLTSQPKLIHPPTHKRKFCLKKEMKGIKRGPKLKANVFPCPQYHSTDDPRYPRWRLLRLALLSGPLSIPTDWAQAETREKHV